MYLLPSPQLFGLVNTLLSTDRDTSKKDLGIQRYSVVPLSPNSGLISWVAQCDTLHALIKEYREAKKIILNVEHRLMLAMAPDYDALPVLNKLEVFEHTLANTTGHDIARVLWLRSRNAEHWLLRRTTYTRSLAVMSMVGYILGLGDRHPSNLMLDRLTGKILHIDFGDCFEVAVHRDKFPEKIPFRLTRMLVDAMEVRSGQSEEEREEREQQTSAASLRFAFLCTPFLLRRRDRTDSNADGRPFTPLLPHQHPHTRHPTHTSTYTCPRSAPRPLCPHPPPPQVSGIEGNFRSTCEAVMGMLRHNKDSVLAMLEAFVHDPLINWRLLARGPDANDDSSREGGSSTGGGRPRSASVGTRAHVSSRRSSMELLPSLVGTLSGMSGCRSRTTSMGGLPDVLLDSLSGAALTSAVSERLQGLQGSIGPGIQPSSRMPSREVGRESIEMTASAVRELNSSSGEQTDSEWQHPASLIGTPRDEVPSEAKVTGIPESSSVLGSRWSRVEAAAAQLDEAALNDRAVSVLRRVKSKLAGSDFPDQAARLDVATQVNRLIAEAQSDLNLCQLYVGWCPFW